MTNSVFYVVHNGIFLLGCKRAAKCKQINLNVLVSFSWSYFLSQYKTRKTKVDFCIQTLGQPGSTFIFISLYKLNFCKDCEIILQLNEVILTQKAWLILVTCVKWNQIFVVKVPIHLCKFGQIGILTFCFVA